VLDEVLIHDVYRLRHDDIRAELAGRVVVDVGAHIGTFTIAALDAGAAHVVAVEPNRATETLLRANVSAYAGAVTIVTAAVGDPARTGRVVPAGRSATAHVVPARPAQVLDVPVLDFAQVLAIAREWIPAGELVAMLKVDCEGSEYDWFATATAELLADVNRIVMEWHGPATAAHLAHDPDAYGRLLTRLASTHAVSVFGRPDQGGLLYAHPYEQQTGER
jgi:FkbM family methyltransferase